MRVAPTITVTETDRETLERWARGRSTPVRLMQRAQIVLAAALGRDNQDIAEAVGVSRQLVGRWGYCQMLWMKAIRRRIF